MDPTSIAATHSTEVQRQLCDEGWCDNWRDHQHVWTITAKFKGDHYSCEFSAALIDKKALERLGKDEFAIECYSYHLSPMHTPETNKAIEYLTSTTFSQEHKDLLAEAGWVLYVDEVGIQEQYERGRGIGMLAMDRMLQALLLGADSLVVLHKKPMIVWQAGGNGEEDDKEGWEAMGFEAWNEEKPDWLCMWTDGRPGIEDVVPELFEAEEEPESEPEPPSGAVGGSFRPNFRFRGRGRGPFRGAGDARRGVREGTRGPRNQYSNRVWEVEGDTTRDVWY